MTMIGYVKGEFYPAYTVVDADAPGTNGNSNLPDWLIERSKYIQELWDTNQDDLVTYIESTPEPVLPAPPPSDVNQIGG